MLDNEFYSRIKRLRQNTGLSQKEFAEKIGVAAATLSAYENGVKWPSLQTAKKIAEIFNVSIDWLCGLTDKMNDMPDPKPKTFGDVFRLIAELDKLINNDLIYDVEEGKSSVANVYSPFSTPIIRFPDSELKVLFSSWAKMKEVLYNGDLPPDVYEMWKIGQADKLDKKLLPWLKQENQAIDDENQVPW